MKHHKIVYEDEATERVDAFLARSGLVHSRSMVEKLVEQGLVKVQGQVARKSTKLKQGDIVEFEVPPPEPIDPDPEDIPLTIVYEDDQIVVVDKPSGMLSHPSRGYCSGTLVNALLFHIKDLSGIRGSFRPGIVHRLDRDTSGLMVVAKSDLAHSVLQEQFKAHSIKKKYLAVVYGVPKKTSGELDSNIGRHPTNRKLMASMEDTGKEALTHYKVLQSGNGFALVELDLKTGRTHQIRVHLSGLGHSVVGDRAYGGGPSRAKGMTNQTVRQAAMAMPRQALHAYTLGFVHPANGKRLSFKCRPPEDFMDLVERLEFEIPE